MFKTETHLHTKPVSNCGQILPKDMIDLYHDAGYTTVFVSDHFARHHFDKFGENLTWQQKTEMLYGAYLEAKKRGEEYGMKVLFSPELSLDGNHYLLYGADMNFLNSKEDIFDMTFEEFYHHAKKFGITIIQAHPYRDGSCFPTPEYIDGIEAVNTNPRHDNFDEKCFELAKKYNFPMSAGSDAHRLEDVAGAAVVSETEITSTEEYLSLLKAGKLKLMKQGEIL